MAPPAHMFFLLVIFPKGLSEELISTQRMVTAAIGEEAVLKCHLTQSKDVRQVTWQKITAGGVENVATYTRRFGHWVNPLFQRKVEFGEAGLQNSSIVIRRVTKQDECCYRCLFNAYPEGALAGNTCLQIYELHKPILYITKSNTSEEFTVSCSATAQPAPTVTLNVPGHVPVANSSSVSVTNANGTVTVTAAVTLAASSLHGNDTQVRCEVSLFSDIVKEVSMTISAAYQAFSYDVGVISAACVAVFCLLLFFIIFAAVKLVLLRIRENGNGRSSNDPESKETPITIKEVQELLDTQPVRQRISPVKPKQNYHS